MNSLSAYFAAAAADTSAVQSMFFDVVIKLNLVVTATAEKDITTALHSRLLSRLLHLLDIIIKVFKDLCHLCLTKRSSSLGLWRPGRWPYFPL